MRINITITPSLNNVNTYYLFRPNGQEIKIQVLNNKIKTPVKLSPEESNYIRENYFN